MEASAKEILIRHVKEGGRKAKDAYIKMGKEAVRETLESSAYIDGWGPEDTQTMARVALECFVRQWQEALFHQAAVPTLVTGALFFENYLTEDSSDVDSENPILVTVTSRVAHIWVQYYIQDLNATLIIDPGICVGNEEWGKDFRGHDPSCFSVTMHDGAFPRGYPIDYEPEAGMKREVVMVGEE